MKSGTDAQAAIRVLVVEDAASQRLVLEKQVASLGYAVDAASDGRDALEQLRGQRPQIVITDWVMPGVDGIELCRIARASDWGRLLYIIILTAHGDESRLIEALDAGANDYLIKPVNPRELQARLRAATRVVELQAELDRRAERLEAMNAKLVEANRRLYDFAHTDALTGLPNRRFIIDRLQQEWALFARKRVPFSVLLLDIDHFKAINDEHGHDAGDGVLQRVAQILRREIRTEDTVGRFGGEEFLIIAPVLDREAAMCVAERVRAAIAREPFGPQDAPWSISASVGVASARPAMEEARVLLKRADLALYEAKGAGRNRIHG